MPRKLWSATLWLLSAHSVPQRDYLSTNDKSVGNRLDNDRVRNRRAPVFRGEPGGHNLRAGVFARGEDINYLMRCDSTNVGCGLLVPVFQERNYADQLRGPTTRTHGTNYPKSIPTKPFNVRTTDLVPPW